MVTASLDNTARVWDAATGKPLTGALAHQGGGAERRVQRIEVVGIRFSAVLGMRSVPAKYREEFIALAENAMKLLRASGITAPPRST